MKDNTIKTYLDKELSKTSLDLKNFMFGGEYNFSIQATNDGIYLSSTYDNDPQYESTFILNINDAEDLASALIDAVNSFKKFKRSENLIKGAFEEIKKRTSKEGSVVKIVKTRDTDPNTGYPVYSIKVYSGVVVDVSYLIPIKDFATKEQIDSFLKNLVGLDTVKVICVNFDFYKDLEKRMTRNIDAALENARKGMVLGMSKPIPIKKNDKDLGMKVADDIINETKNKK